MSFGDSELGRRQWSNGATMGFPPEVAATLDVALDVIEAAEEERDLTSLTWLGYRPLADGSRSIRLGDGHRLQFRLDGEVLNIMGIEVVR